jgi:primosomal protein N'
MTMGVLSSSFPLVPNNTMQAFIVPYRKTPRGIDGFDYHVPPHLHADIRPGVIVRVPFRQQLIDGLVYAVYPDAEPGAVELREIESIVECDFWKSTHRLRFLEWFARTHWVSLPTAWKTMQFPLPRREVPESTLSMIFDEAQALVATSSPSLPISPEPQGSAESPTNSGLEVLREQYHLWSHTEGLFLYRQQETLRQWYTFLASQHQGLCMILTPEQWRTVELVHELRQQTDRPIIQVESDARPRQWFALQKELLNTTDASTLAPILVGTKKLLFLRFPRNTLIVIDNEHEKTHKQYDQNPRYRSTSLTHFFADQMPASADLKILYSSYAPSLRAWKHFFDGNADLLRVPEGQTLASQRVEVADMNNLQSAEHPGWLSMSAVEELRSTKKVLLFINRVGKNQFSVCGNCGSTLAGNGALCSVCGSTLIQIHRKGIDQLEKEFSELFPSRVFAQIDSQSTDEEIARALSSADTVIATEKVFRVQQTHRFDVIVVLSVDHLLVYPHFSAQERVFQLLMQLQLQGSDLIIQTYAPHLQIFQDVVNRDALHFAETELRLREQLNLPPVTSHWLIKYPRSTEMKRVDSPEELERLHRSVLIDWVEG